MKEMGRGSVVRDDVVVTLGQRQKDGNEGEEERSGNLLAFQFQGGGAGTTKI